MILAETPTTNKSEKFLLPPLSSLTHSTMTSSSSHHFSFFYLSQNDQTTLPPPQNPNSIPIQSSSTPTPIPVHYPASILAAAAAKIQSTYRSHLVRALIRKILAINSEADRLQRLIQQQETVDSVRSSDRERIRLSEKLMGLLLELDSVPGHFDPNVRALRRSVSRRIVGLQEILDGVVGERMELLGEGLLEELPGSLREFVEKIWAGEERAELRRRCSCSCLEEFFMGTDAINL